MHGRHLRCARIPARKRSYQRIDYPSSYEGMSGQEQEAFMTVLRFFWKTGRGLTVAAAILAAIGLTTMILGSDRGMRPHLAE